MSEINEHLFIGRVVKIMRICAMMPPYKPFGCAEVARRMSKPGEEFPKQTAMRILKGLAHHGYIIAREDGKKFYRPRVSGEYDYDVEF